MIEGVQVKQLKWIPDERGRLMEILRSDETLFEKFGQAYITTTMPGVIKAWHSHKLQADCICCVKGMIKLVIYDMRPGSKTKGELNELFIGEFNPALVKIASGLHHGWKCVSEQEALIVNVPTQPYNAKQPDEYRLPFNTKEIPYSWGIVMK